MKKQLFLTCIISLGLFCFAYAEQPKKVLIGSPVYQKPAILKEFLDSLMRLEKKTFTVDYFFVDDNVQEESSKLLADFSKQQTESMCYVVRSSIKTQLYICNEITHFWNEDLIWKVAHFKNQMIQHAAMYDYDYLFLIDSDMILHPKTIDHLITTQKKIVSEIFWTKWTPDQCELPNAWICDSYTLYEKSDAESISQEEAIKRQTQFLEKLRIPGTYEVGGLCACTLVNKEALKAGVSFKKIKNLTFWGEDRHFCTRAAVLDIPLFMDTHYPAYHIYRESALPGVKGFVEQTTLDCLENNK